MNEQELSDHIGRIHLINKTWKLMSERYGPDSPLTLALKNRKSSLQVELLRLSAGRAWLQRDLETPGVEPLFSVRFDSALSDRLSGRKDADHLPVRVAEELLTDNELKGVLR